MDSHGAQNGHILFVALVTLVNSKVNNPILSPNCSNHT